MLLDPLTGVPAGELIMLTASSAMKNNHAIHHFIHALICYVQMMYALLAIIDKS